MSESKTRAGQPTLSWMVRCWEEPREQASDAPVYRCFVRDLKTGEERYLGDPRDLGEMVLRKLRETGRASKSAQKNHKIG